ncbi:protein tyrosine phosphatase type IVA 1 isoform 2-T2 [Lycaon pictus]|uniref:protein tyrosine phosphatase type IVA 1 isoform X2 n=1 Tax=Canis lupus familiaris TaxID=9615 RepID=UPI0018F7A5EB|nr:protein tyrosine phosphatase type IVA 1 isoform X2 [Canis lupus familiaris]XP_038539791.1 protein tyrosine phosphatase type IVA 1 isoform X2 [Canis lupus familiaris]XP_038541255.1 protein tyrosine phosphatase type IVA 1 isoform X2 [Canis lupus familiaris]XP_055186263.1 protein tyrosine phosphatase type IVA 1 isoform X2 [Nyctereutes procyonoides]
MARMNRPAPVEVTYKNMRFLITHNPTNATLNKFIEELKKYGVTTIVRVCEATYDTTLVEKEGIHVLDWPFDDGAPPSNQIVDDWLSLVKIKFREEPGCCIAVHCVAGLGRAPVLVALALIEGGMKYEDAVQFIRHGVELLTASNFCIWRSIVLKCGCASKTPMVIETTVAFNKTGVPDVIALEVELETGPNLSYIHISQYVGLVIKSNEASIGVLESGFIRPQV